MVMAREPGVPMEPLSYSTSYFISGAFPEPETELGWTGGLELDTLPVSWYWLLITAGCNVQRSQHLIETFWLHVYVYSLWI